MASDSSDSPRPLPTRIARWGGGLLGGLLVLLLAVALILPQLFTSEELKGYVIPPMEEATGRTVEIDEIGLRVLWTPAVSVSGFTLANREGYGPEPGVEAKHLNVEIAIWPLLTGGVEPTAVELVDPVVRYEIGKDGSTNFDDLLASEEKAPQEESGGINLPISNFRTTGAQVRYEDRSTGQSLHLNFGARLSALLDGDAISSEGTVDLETLRAVLPEVQDDTLAVTDAQIDYDLRTNLAEGRLDLSALTLKTAPLTLSTTGSVTELNTRPTLDLTVEAEEADLAQLAAFAPAAAVEGLNPTGTLQLTTTVTGPLSEDGGLDALTVDGTGTLSGIGVDYQGEKLLRDLNAEMALSLNEFALRSLQGQLLGTSLSGSVAVSDLMNAPRVALDVTTGAMNLASLAAFAPPEQVKGLNPQGTLALDLTAKGPVDAPEKIVLNGGGTLAGVGVDYDGTPMLRDLGATLAVSNTAASVKKLEGQLLGKPLTGEVTVREPMGEKATVEGRLAGAADLAKLTALAEQDMSASGTADYDVRFSGPLNNPDAIRPTGQIRLSKVRYPYESFRHPVEIPSATVKLTGTGLSMDRFPINTGEQSMALQTTIKNLFPISKGLAETNPAVAVNFAFTSDRLDLIKLYPEADESEVAYSDLFAATLSGSKVNGQSPEALAKELYGGTELPAFAVDGTVNIATFLNDPQRIDDLAFDLQIRDRRLTMRNLSGTTYEGKLAGSVTLDQRTSATSATSSASDASMLLASRGAGMPGRSPNRAPGDTKLDYDIALSGARAGAFLEDWTTLGQVVNGTLDLKMNGDTPLSDGFLPVADALTAKGNSVVANGGLSTDFPLTKALLGKLGLSSTFTNFKRLGGPFTIEDGALKTGTWELGSQPANARMNGAFGLGGSLDLAMNMELPLSTLQNSKIPGLAGGGVGEIVQKLAGGKQGSETIPVKIGIGGTMTNPKVEIVDKDAFKSSLQKLVKEEGLNRVRNLFEGRNR